MNEELRPKPVPKPAEPRKGALRPDQLPGEGRPPMKSGKTVISDFTRKNLEAVGWKDGDPLPNDLGAYLQKMHDAVAEERASTKLENTELAAGWTPPKPKFVNIDDLPEDRKEEIRQYLQEYKETVNQQQREEDRQQAVDSRIPDNIQGDQREAMREQIIAGEQAAADWQNRTRENAEESVVIDDRKTEPAAEQQKPVPHPEPAPVSPPTRETETTGVDDAAAHNCPRCSWPVAKAFDVECEDADKEMFIAAILGISRFEKSYKLLNGNLVVYFRSLTTEESALLTQQLGFMVRTNIIAGEAEYWANMTEFRLAMSVSRIDTGGQVVYTAKPVQEWAEENKEVIDGEIQPTPIPYLRDYFYKKGVTQEPVRRIIGTEHRKFQRLVELLETMTDDADFWKGIELHD